MHTPSPRRWLGDFVLLAAIWGTSFLFMRIAAAELGPLATAGLRVGIASLFLWPLLWLRGQTGLLRQHCKPILLVGVLNSGIPFALYAFAVMHISTGLSSILNATVPLFGALVAWSWLGDRPGFSRSLGLAIGFGGIVLLAGDQVGFKPHASGFSPLWAVLACLGATSCYALAASFTTKHLPPLPSLVTATGSQIGATLALALPALWWHPGQWPGLSTWGALLALGVMCTGVAYVLYFRLIERAGPARAMTVTYLVPVFAVAYGVLVLDESLTPWMLGCGAVILSGTALASGLVRLARPSPGRARP
ncbi:MAG: EamA/RhaT family transporter [Betaproteobacteria bacterium]|nr:EamA/RhaT family transporter [Betaproteobacteria bacterium]